MVGERSTQVDTFFVLKGSCPITSYPLLYAKSPIRFCPKGVAELIAPQLPGPNRVGDFVFLSNGGMMIKAIETVYKGYRFRSRLEARWAVFFDALGIEYQYEVEGFEFEGSRYLPDFWLPQFEVWAEIKPDKGNELPFDYRCKMRAFSKESGYPLIILQGEPYRGAFDVEIFPDSCVAWTAGVTSFSFVDFLIFKEYDANPTGHLIGIVFIKDNGLHIGGLPLGPFTHHDKSTNAIEQAYLAARQARFGKDGQG